MPQEEETLRAMRAAFGMTRQRCYNVNCRDYKYYGGRGITIHQPWLDDFSNFVKAMGLRPSGMTLERINNDGPYNPDNCIWAPRKTQSNNTRLVHRITYQGQTHTIAEWERRLGWKAGVLKARLGRLGYSLEQAFTKPVQCGVKLEGRSYKVRRKPDLSHTPRGYDSPNTVLGKPDVKRARDMYSGGGETFTSLAKRFGVSIETMSQAIQGQKAYRD